MNAYILEQEENAMRGQKAVMTEHIQQHKSGGGLYFTVHDQNEDVIATSRVFRNEAWFKVGLQLFMCAAKAMVFAKRPEKAMERCLYADQYRFIVDNRPDTNAYYFEFITTSGRTLLTSRDFDTHEAAMDAVYTMQRVASRTCV